MGNDLFALTVRVFYRKLGRVKYISHLDMVRCICRALKRSGLPVWHTLGFNPHIYVTFALPLALGYESECESMDFRLTEQIPMETVVERLNAVLPMGITCFEAAPALAKPDVICWSDYEITQEFDEISPETAAAEFAEWCARETIPIVKKGKKGERTIDAKPSFSVWDTRSDAGALRFTMRAAAGNTLNINPTLLLDTFAADGGAKADWLRVVRTAVLDAEWNQFK